jgi:recombination protein RecT
VVSVTAQFQLGYKGYIQLAIRSGYYKKINVLAIKEGELIKYDPLNEEIAVNLIENDEEREAAQTSGYYAMFEYQNGFKKAMYWSMKKMQAHADQYSQAFSIEAYRKLQAGKVPKSDMWKYSSFWYKNFDDMALKTMLRQLISKWGIMSIEMQTAFERDDTLQNEDGSFEYVSNESQDNVIDITPTEQPQPAEDDPADEPADQEFQETFFSQQ